MGELDGRGGVSEGQSHWAEDMESSGRMWSLRGIGSLDKRTVLHWPQGKVTDVGINLILCAPRQYRPVVERRAESTQLL